MGKIKILIVDDEKIVVEGIRKNLEVEGYAVTAILGGKEAIELLKKEFFHIVLVDLVMLGMNGVETCKGIKAVSPETEVIFISGFPQEIEKYLMAFIKAGGVDLLLRKPLLDAEIETSIKRFIAKKNIK